ncbi:MAG: hypothetical protein C5S38_07300 [Candidatus Methanophagaceae archaeon]|nr:MAG: hypothetical protein C5S38_07300 [Methanophagales archaeon]KAF5436272.1 Nicotinic acid phosphoribosyltransferase [Methanophagales archaeon]
MRIFCGIDGVNCVVGAEQIGIKPAGTMPHALNICLCEGQQKEAGQAFNGFIAE